MLSPIRWLLSPADCMFPPGSNAWATSFGPFGPPRPEGLFFIHRTFPDRAATGQADALTD